MPLKSFIAVALTLAATHAAATPPCPTTHFVPVVSFGDTFGRSGELSGHAVENQGEEYLFQYVEYQTFEDGYDPVFVVNVLKTDRGSSRVSLVRRRSGEATERLEVSFRSVSSALAARFRKGLEVALRNTHYTPGPCDNEYLDGYVAQILVPQVSGYGDLAGEVYSPPEDSQAGAAVALGRTLRHYVEGTQSERAIEVVLAALERHNQPLR